MRPRCIAFSASVLVLLQGSSLQAQEREESPADEHIAPQLVRPAFTDSLLQITADVLADLESTLRPPRQSEGGSMEEYQRRLANAKSEEEARRIVLEMQQSMTGAASAERAAYDHERFIETASEAMRTTWDAAEEWRSCVSSAGRDEELRVGAGTLAVDAAARARVQATAEAERKACGARPAYPDAPAPASSWQGSARAWYTLLDRALAFCTSDILHIAADGTAGVDIEADFLIDHTYSAAEADVLRARCDPLMAAVEESGFGS